MGRRCALLVLLALVSPAEQAAARPTLVDMAVDHDGRAFLVSASRSAVRLRSAAPGAAFAPGLTLRVRAVDAAVASDGSGAIVVQSGRRVRESSRSTPEARSGRRASCRAAVRPTSPRRRWRVVAPRSSSGSGTRARGAGASRLPCATLERRRSVLPSRCRGSCGAPAVRTSQWRSATEATPSPRGARHWTRRSGRHCAGPASRFGRHSGWPRIRATIRRWPSGGWNGGGALQPATRTAARRRRAATAASRARRRVRRTRGREPRSRRDDRRNGDHAGRASVGGLGRSRRSACSRVRVRTRGAAGRSGRHRGRCGSESRRCAAADDGRAVVAWSQQVRMRTPSRRWPRHG